MARDLFSELDQTRSTPGTPAAPCGEPEPDEDDWLDQMAEQGQEFIGAPCTLDGWPAKLLRWDETTARLEPVALEGPEPIHCSWVNVADLMENWGGRFESDTSYAE